MKILYAAMQYDYGVVENGLSFEHVNFFDALHNMGHDIIYFDYMAILRARGREVMNRLLLETVSKEEPELLFSIMYRDELDPAVVHEISSNTGTTTLNWFCDDHWRFETFSARWAPEFNWVVTTAPEAVEKYAALGIGHVIKSQWACNHYRYRLCDGAPEYDVTFVGQPHGNRREMLRMLKQDGIRVQTWGAGWPAGRLGPEQMIHVFGSSRINLNLPNASIAVGDTPSALAPVPGHFSALLDRTSAGRSAKRALRPAVGRLRGVRASLRPPTAGTQFPQQIKARNFEVPGCGGFMLTGAVDDLSSYYVPGKEVAVFDDADDLRAKIVHYLGSEDERAAIAQAGYRRTLAEHTYAHRFRDIFHRMGLARDGQIDLDPHPGSTREVTA